MERDLDQLGDAALVARTRGEPEAFAALYRRYERPILGYLVRRLGSGDLAADAAAETFAGALASIRRGALPQGEVSAWLFGIARIKAAEAHRKGFCDDAARRELAMAPVDLTPEQEVLIEALGGDDRVSELVDGLPEAQRAAIVARILDERDYLDIAEEQDCSEATIRQRVSRGLATIRTRLVGTTA